MPLEIIRNDITKMRVDAIVNAANHTLLGGGGVDGAIHRAAGPQLLEACRALNGCPTGQAKITRGYRLPARYVIHTVGPVWRGGQYGEEGLLASCYTHSLELARENGCETVAFPLISAGVYGYPKDQALSVAMRAIGDYLTRYDMLVYLVLFGREEFSQGQKLYENVQAYIDDVYVDAHFHSNVEAARKMLWQLDREKAAEYDQALNESYKALDDLMDTEVSLYISIRDPDQQKPASSHADRVGEAQPHAPTTAQPDWDAMLRQADEGFSQMLLRKIDEKGITDAQCYKKANVDRKLFSKIRSNPAYRPSKPTVFAFAVALELNLEDTKTLLEKAGFALSHSSKFDIILEYFIKTRNYNVFEINEVLFHYDLALLGGSSM